MQIIRLRRAPQFRCPYCHAPHLEPLPPLPDPPAFSPLVLLFIGGISGACLVGIAVWVLNWVVF